MAWNSPLTIDRLIELTRVAGLAENAHLIDLGCGSGELLSALVRDKRTGFGVDLDESLIGEARTNAGQGGTPCAEFICGDAATVQVPTGAALGICMGSTHAFGQGNDALIGTLARMDSIVAPGGYALLGEGYKMRELDPEYAAFLGTPTGMDRTHAEVVESIEECGWSCEHAITATEAEWDAFEWAFYRRKRKREWRAAWLRWGRDTMGFGAYLAQRPGQ